VERVTQKSFFRSYGNTSFISEIKERCLKKSCGVNISFGGKYKSFREILYRLHMAEVQFSIPNTPKFLKRTIV